MGPIQDFSYALFALREGKSVYRVGWNAHNILTLQIPTETSKMTRPYIYMTTAQGDIVPWVASQTDILSDDWEIQE